MAISKNCFAGDFVEFCFEYYCFWKEHRSDE